MTTTASSEFYCVPEFQAEKWMACIAPRVQRIAVRKLYGYGMRGELLEETADDIVQIMAMKAMKTPALSDPEARALLAVTVRHEVVSWMRKWQRVHTESLVDEEAGGDGPDDEPRTAGLPITASAEDLAFTEDGARERELARLEASFRADVRAQVARLIRDDEAFRRRLRKSGASRASLFAILRRSSLLATLVQHGGRDMDDGTTAEAAQLAARYGADLRTVRNRRSDWLRFLRERYGCELGTVLQDVKRLYPELRAG